MRLGPYMVPTRTMVYVLFYRMHNNRNLWHKPEEFLPERWAEQEDPEKHSTTPAADAGSTVAAGLGEDILARNEKKYLPFSEGPRGCLGQVRRLYLTCCRPSKHSAWQLHELGVPANTSCDVFLSPNAPWHSNEAATLYILNRCLSTDTAYQQIAVNAEAGHHGDQGGLGSALPALHVRAVQPSGGYACC